MPTPKPKQILIADDDPAGSRSRACTAPPDLRPTSAPAATHSVDVTALDEGVHLRRLLQARLIRESGIVLIGHPLLIALVSYATWDEIPHAVAAGWALAVLLATAFRSVWLRTANQRALTDRDIWLGVRMTVTLLGLCWGVGVAIVVQDLPFAHAALLLVVLSAIIAAALTTLSADSVSFLGFVIAISRAGLRSASSSASKIACMSPLQPALCCMGR